MRKKLSAVGNSLGVLIDKPILELLKIDRDTEIEVSTDGTRLILEPVREDARQDRKKKIKALHAEVLKEHDETFRKLAK